MISDTLVWCSRCETHKAPEAFAKKWSTPNGLHKHCRDCHSHAMKGAQQRRALPQPGAGYRCPICGTDRPGGRANKWTPDHDHDTGVTRDFICYRCNLGLGLLKDCPPSFAGALAYLAKHGRALTQEQFEDFATSYMCM